MPNIVVYTVIDIPTQSHFHGVVKFVDDTYSVLGGTVFICNSSGGGFTVTLPAAAAYPERILTFKQISATNTVTIAAADNIDGSGSVGLSTQYEFVTVVSDGSTWHIIG